MALETVNFHGASVTNPAKSLCRSIVGDEWDDRSVDLDEVDVQMDEIVN